MRTVILYSSGHLGSATILNRLVRMPCYEVVGIVKTRPVPFSVKGARKLKKHLKHVGWRFGWLLFWQQTIQLLGYAANAVLPSSERSLKPTWRLAMEREIPIHRCVDINDEASQKFIRDMQPELIVSAYFNQIVGKAVLAIPEKGILNVHPGWLPAYRGAMGYFWVLRNGCDQGGVSVHWMDEGIDTGRLLARRTFNVSKGMTQPYVLVLTAVIGAGLLKRIGQQLSSGESPEPIDISSSEEIAYYPMPGEVEFDEYFVDRRYFRIRDILGYLQKK